MPEESRLLTQQRLRVILSSIALLVMLLSSIWLLPFLTSASASAARHGAAVEPPQSDQAKASASIDYPEDGSIFPPGITPPTFIWRDANATSWHISISFSDKSPAIQAVSHGERMRIGP